MLLTPRQSSAFARATVQDLGASRIREVANVGLGRTDVLPFWFGEPDQVTPDFKPAGGTNTHHTVLYEWSAKDASAATYDGGAPREMMRFEKPFSNHNGSLSAFNPLAKPGSADYGLLYLGNADGGSGGDPFNSAQNLSSGYGKLFRIDPLGRTSVNGKYGVPASNPFANGQTPGALPEIWAYGMRNPQRFNWDPANGNIFLADIGQNLVEKVSLVTAGANLGWNVWEGSFGDARAAVDTSRVRGDAKITYPAVEYQHEDSLFQRQVAVTGVHIFRSAAIPALRDKVLFGDNPSGELFYFDADRIPNGGSGDIHRVLLRSSGAEPKTLLALIREKNAQQGKQIAGRADLRFGHGPDGRLFLLNKADGTIRVLIP